MSGQLRERQLVLRVRQTCRYKAVFRASTSDAVRVGAVTMFACRSPKSSDFGGERRDGGALWPISPPRGQLRERHLVLRVRETCPYKALFGVSASEAVRVAAVTMFACRSPKNSDFGRERRGWGCAVADIIAARAATRATLSSSCSRDMPLQGRVQSQCERCRPSRHGDDVRVSLSEKQPFRRRKTGMGVRCGRYLRRAGSYESDT